MKLIDTTYYEQGKRHIFNASVGATSPACIEVCGYIDAFIADYQDEFLSKMLGDKLAPKVSEYLNSLDNAEAEHNSLYDQIITGLKESYADYVFFHILTESSTQATMTGVQLLKSANSNVSPDTKAVQAWNRMVENNRKFEQWAFDACKDIFVNKYMLIKVNRFAI